LERKRADITGRPHPAPGQPVTGGQPFRHEKQMEEGGLAAPAAADPGHPMTPFAPLFIDRCPTGEMSVAEMYLETTFPAFSRDNVESALEGSGIDIPPVDAQMLDRYIGYLAGIDFL
jgi:hypothetical protein